MHTRDQEFLSSTIEEMISELRTAQFLVNRGGITQEDLDSFLIFFDENYRCLQGVIGAYRD